MPESRKKEIGIDQSEQMPAIVFPYACLATARGVPLRIRSSSIHPDNFKKF
jgi:hypothetical protein